ncbi:MAG TPA: CinA family nicotinamide mononucleotide deamidase-related protein [Kofleriaceae bacterium]|nr:CinA family nicotinamide mononucleotide deamidase-related protein [Kofleriaceae bacterium]
MFAEILTIGDELTRGEIVDTNSSYLAAQLWDRDITVRWMTSCRDDQLDMRRAFGDAVRRADLVICSGGLGPTEDDLTVDVVAQMVGAEAVVDEPARARMAARFAQAGAPMHAIQERQVRVPSGSIVHGNPAGLAPCFEVSIGGVPVICLPGVPREIYSIMDSALGARLTELRAAKGSAPRIARRIYRVFGRGESQISLSCRGVVDEVPGASIHYQVKYPEVLVKIVVADPDEAAARSRLEQIDLDLRGRLGGVLYGTGDDALPVVCARALAGSGLTVGTAESCTGGLLGVLLTDVAGSSKYVKGGVIAYANEIKVRELGVSSATLDEHGAVSEACVREMAEGARGKLGVDLAVALSGVAGPDGGTPEKPVGTTWLALAAPHVTVTKKINFPGARDANRTLAAWWGLRMIIDMVEEMARGK